MLPCNDNFPDYITIHRAGATDQRGTHLAAFAPPLGIGHREDTMAELICGVFPSRGQAEEALDALTRAGYNRADLGIALTVYPKAAARVAGGGLASMRTWVPNEHIVNLPGLGEAIVGGTIGQCVDTLGDCASLADALCGLGVAHDHASWYQQHVRDGATLVTLLTDDGNRVAAIMRQRGAIQIPAVERDPGDNRVAPNPSAERNPQWQPSSADLSMDAADDMAGAFPGWEPGGPGYSGLVPQQHEDGANVPREPEE